MQVSPLHLVTDTRDGRGPLPDTRAAPAAGAHGAHGVVDAALAR